MSTQAPLSASGGATADRLVQAAQGIIPEHETDPVLAALAVRLQELARADRGPLCATVLALADTQAVSRMIFLEDSLFSLCQRAARRNGGLVEVRLQPKGFVIEDGARRSEFESLDSFLAALGNSTVVRDRSAEPLKLHVSIPGRSVDWYFLIPESFMALEDNPALVEQLAAQGDFVVLAGPPDSTLPPNDAGILRTLLASIPGLQCVITGAAGAVRPRWVEEMRGTLNLPAFHPATADASGWLAGDRPGTRQIVRDYRRVRETGGLIEQIRAAMNGEAKRLQQSRADCEARSAATNSGTEAANEARRFGENCLQMLNEDVGLLIRNREDVTRDLMLPRGVFYDLVRRLSESVGEKELIFTDDHKSTRLKPREEGISELQQRTLRRLFNDFEKEAALVNDALEASVEELNKRLAEAQEGTEPLRWQRYDPGRLLDFAGTVVTAPVTFKGEIPRITPGNFLWQTVQHPVMIIFTLMMPATMFASQRDVATHIRDWRFDVALWGLLPLYIITPFYLHKKFTRERQAGLDRELDRYRQTIQVELDRSVRMSLDEKKRLVSEYLRISLDELRRQTADRVQQIAQARERKRQADRAQAVADIQRADVRVKELTSRAQQCDKLKTETDNLRRMLETSWNPLG